jgi:type II secretory pathway pseudopilin PulG
MKSSLTCKRKQGGVVLVVAIVILAIVSILAAYSTRNASSAEQVSNNVRLTELATQAADIALRHCERSAADVVAEQLTGESTYDRRGFASDNIFPAEDAWKWQTPAEWDKAPPVPYVLPLNVLNEQGLNATYKRAPECMVGRIPMRLSSGAVTITRTFVVTARGFGPDVDAANANRTRPAGSEVWLQSHIELE